MALRIIVGRNQSKRREAGHRDAQISYVCLSKDHGKFNKNHDFIWTSLYSLKYNVHTKHKHVKRYPLPKHTYLDVEITNEFEHDIIKLLMLYHYLLLLS